MPERCLKSHGSSKSYSLLKLKCLLSKMDYCNLRLFFKMIPEFITFRLQEWNILEDFKTIV